MKKSFSILAFIIAALSMSVYGEELTLENAIGTALSNNLEIRGFHKIVKIVKAEKGASYLPENPEIFIENEEIPDGSSFGDAEEKKFGIEQKIELPFKWYYRGRQTSLISQKYDQKMKSLKMEIIFQAASVYYKIAMLNLKHSYYTSILENIRDLFKKDRIRYDLGEIALSEFLRVKAEQAHAELEVRDMENEQSKAYLELQYVLNTDRNYKISDELTCEKGEDIPLVLNDEQISEHPEIMEIKKAEEAAGASRKLEFTNLLPDLNLEYTIVERPVTDEKFWGMRFGLEIPVWFPAKERNKINRARYEHQAQKIEYEKARKKFSLEYGRMVSELKRLEKKVEMYIEDILASNQKIFDMILKGYHEGEYGYLDLWEAHKNLTGSKIEYAEVLYEHQIALLEVERKLGKGLFE